ncbi:MAG: cobalt-precorrin-4/precorrin-4 C(11)-methyltransferase, partial [Desulfovibrio sp.]|nr:cobalt-precorrin-4/precorrin-4 C(11)-methyltransferase [Desulfovibrio sp.]
EIGAILCETATQGGVCARVHTGDPSLYGALREEIDILERHGIAWESIPGVTAACAAAAKAGISFTIPTQTQTLIISRMQGRTPMPEEESIHALARHKTSLAIYLSGKLCTALQNELLMAGLTPETAILCAHRVGWPDEKLVWTNLQSLPRTVEKEHLERQTVILVLPKEDRKGEPSCLYSKAFSHSFRSEDTVPASTP